MPTPTARERRLALRVRANELLELLEGIEPTDPEAEQARPTFGREFAALARRAPTPPTRRAPIDSIR